MTAQAEKIIEQFVVPEPYKAWCHQCDRGFISLDDLMKHVKDDHRVYKG